MKRIMIGSLFAFAAFAQDRTITILEVSIVPTGGDVTFAVPYDGGCDIVPRIQPVADQKASTLRRFPKAFCDNAFAGLTKAAKLDQSVGNGAKP